MRFVLASYGTRGDVEPSVVLARELQHGGHDVLMADLRRILRTQCSARARILAQGTSRPADGHLAAADVGEDFARSRTSA